MYVYYGNPNETNNNIIRSQKISPTSVKSVKHKGGKTVTKNFNSTTLTFLDHI